MAEDRSGSVYKLRVSSWYDDKFLSHSANHSECNQRGIWRGRGEFPKDALPDQSKPSSLQPSPSSIHISTGHQESQPICLPKYAQLSDRLRRFYRQTIRSSTRMIPKQDAPSPTRRYEVLVRWNSQIHADSTYQRSSTTTTSSTRTHPLRPSPTTVASVMQQDAQR